MYLNSNSYRAELYFFNKMQIADVYFDFMYIALADMVAKYAQALAISSNMYHRFDRIEIKVRGGKS